jgi:adenylyl- and sulfurtransferase ThiI
MVFCFSAMAQHGKGEGRGRMHKEIKAQKISYITQKLELTPEEAQLFWPVYNELEKKKDALRKEGRVLFHKIRNGLDSIPESELVQISDDMIAYRIKDAQLNKEYHEKFKKILPIKKVLELYHTEKQFQSMLLRKIKEKGRHMGRKERN